MSVFGRRLNNVTCLEVHHVVYDDLSITGMNMLTDLINMDYAQ